MTKTELRKTLLQTRRAMTMEDWQQKSLQICHHLQACTVFIQAQTVLAYFSFRQEPDLSPLFSLNKFNLDKTWGFPRCVERELFWHQWTPQSNLCLKPGPFGILEPDPRSPMITPEVVDLLLIPAVACDARGYRLGYGGGFYDRLLSSPNWRNKPAIAILFDFAQVPHLPEDAWDQPLQAICTETGLRYTGVL